MRYMALLLLGVLILAGCSTGQSDSAQQQLAKEWSPEKVAEAYEKAGKHKEAEEVRRGMQQGQQ